MSDAEESILLRLEAEGRQAPRVRLKSDEGEAPALRRSGRFEILGEFARGGVGRILKGRDIDLGRDVALKVLHDEVVQNADVVQRFVDEAQIGGQLQHPGIVPVYELGLQEGKRPFFAMKLVKGSTLAALVKESRKPRRRLLHVFEQVCQTIAYAHARGVIHRDLKPSNVMVGAFGEVQVLDWGFAKVLARGGVADEKPTAEIDVTRIATLRSKGEGSESIAGSVMGTPAYMPPEQALGEIDALDERSDVFSLGAMLCEILTGLPPYTGEDVIVQAAQAMLDDALARLDACEADKVLVDLARRCLASRRKDRPRDATPLAEEMRGYLTSVEERAHRAAVEATEARGRAEQARSEADDQRRARRLGVAVAASVLIAVAMGGGGFFLLDRAQERRAEMTDLAVTSSIRQAQKLRGAKRWTEALVAAQQADELSRAPEVGERTRGRVQELLTDLEAEEQSARLEEALRERDEKFVAELDRISLQRSDDWDFERSDREYRAAFQAHGIDPMEPDKAFTRIRVEYPKIAIELAAALDEWVWLRRSRLRQEVGAWWPLAQTAMKVDPDKWRGRLRAAMVQRDLTDLRELASEASQRDLSARTLDVIGNVLGSAGEREAAVEFLRKAHARHPDSFWINFHIGHYLRDARESARFYAAAMALRPESAGTRASYAAALAASGTMDEAVVEFRHAIRMDPSNVTAQGDLGVWLLRAGRVDEALPELRKTILLAPDLDVAYANLGAALQTKGRLDEAIAVVRDGIRAEPDSATCHASLACLLNHKMQPDEAIAECRKAISLDARHAPAHRFLGQALIQKGLVIEGLASHREAARLAPRSADARGGLGAALSNAGYVDEALVELREAVRLRPRKVMHRTNLGITLARKGVVDEALATLREAVRIGPGYVNAHTALALELRSRSRLEEAIEVYRTAIRFHPKNLRIRLGLGRTLREVGELDAAITVFREALDAHPQHAATHSELANALSQRGDYEDALKEHRIAIRLAPNDEKKAVGHHNLGLMYNRHGLKSEALAAAREAVRLHPDHAPYWYSLGCYLQNQGRQGEAIDAYREAIKIAPEHAEAYCNLGVALGEELRFQDALAAVRKGHALGTARALWPYPSAEWVRLYESLVALEAHIPAVRRGEVEVQDADQLRTLWKLCHRRRFYAAGVSCIERVLASGKVQPGDRYNAACAAALAGCGRGEDADTLDPAERLRLRQRALGWLREILAAGPERQTLLRWQRDGDLTGVREETGLTTLSESEQEEWRALWDEVAALIEQ